MSKIDYGPVFVPWVGKLERTNYCFEPWNGLVVCAPFGQESKAASMHSLAPPLSPCTKQPIASRRYGRGLGAALGLGAGHLSHKFQKNEHRNLGGGAGSADGVGGW
jgi:hypothetical protein